MSAPLCLALIAVLVVGVLGIVAVGSILQRDELDVRARLDREANPDGEGNDLLPCERWSR
jgi:hypothetical protein